MRSVYERLLLSYEHHSRRLSKTHLPLAKKILLAHSSPPPPPSQDNNYFTHKTSSTKRNKEIYLILAPDRVAMQDASAQMALLQFSLSGKPCAALPTSVHCDHLIQARQGATQDLQDSLVSNKEIFDFLEQSSSKYGLEFWKPGSGIIHQLVLGASIFFFFF